MGRRVRSRWIKPALTLPPCQPGCRCQWPIVLLGGLTAREIAAALRVQVRTVWNRTSDWRVPHYVVPIGRIGRGRRWVSIYPPSSVGILTRRIRGPAFAKAILTDLGLPEPGAALAEEPAPEIRPRRFNVPEVRFAGADPAKLFGTGAGR